MSAQNFWSQFVPELLGLVALGLVTYPALRIYGLQTLVSFLVRRDGRRSKRSVVSGKIEQAETTLKDMIGQFSSRDFGFVIWGALVTAFAAIWKLVVICLG